MKSVTYKNYTITQEANQGTVRVLVDGTEAPKTKPVLRDMARELGVDLHYKTGTVKITRGLGASVIKAIEEREVFLNSILNTSE